MMKIITSLICVLLIIQLGPTASETISCESIGNDDWDAIEIVRACLMNGTTVIDSEGFVIAPADSSVLALDFHNNKKIKFLPIKVDETFPNLVGFYAFNCSLRTVSKKNFKNLKKLKTLGLDNNRIQRIDSDTFEDLTSLERLGLSRNGLKQLNSAAFANLNKLAMIFLRRNVCIHRNYENGTCTEKLSLLNEVNDYCGFDPTDNGMSQSTTLNGISFECLFSILTLYIVVPS